MSVETKTRGRHRLQSNARHGWKTGFDAEGVQTILIDYHQGVVCLRFDSNGRLQLAERLPKTPELEKETTIKVFGFELPEFGIALRELPYDYQEFVDSPWAYDEEERSRLAVDVNQWQERDCFVIIWQGREHLCFRDGLVHS